MSFTRSFAYSIVGLVLSGSVGAAASAGCAANDTDATSGTPGGTTSGPTGVGGAGGGTTTTATGSGGDLNFDAGGAGGGTAPAILYAHDDHTLFQADPAVQPLALEELGDFDCVGGDGQDPNMTDLAVSDTGEIWGISEANVYRLEVQANGVVHCAQTLPLNNPQQINFYALTFAPKGVLDPDAEVLIGGNSAGQLYAIDANGGLTQKGTFGAVPQNDGNGHTYDSENVNKPWALSGDIVFVANEGNPVGFATVRDCPTPPSSNGCNEVDTLIEIDVAAMTTATTGSVTKSIRGLIVKGPGCSDTAAGYGRVYGIAAHQDKVFGFFRSSGDGFAIEIDNNQGTACLVSSYPETPFAGAGITTLAPVVPPIPE
jgi:hypothetical protein